MELEEYFQTANWLGKVLFVLFAIFAIVIGFSIWGLPAYLAVLVFGFGEFQFFIGATIGFVTMAWLARKVDPVIHKILRNLPKK